MEHSTYPPQTTITELRVLERIKFGVSHAISQEHIANFPDFYVDAYWDDICHMMVIKLVAGVWPEQLEHEVPVNFWEELKARFAPRWFVKLFPVKRKVEKLDVWAKYPNLKLACPDQEFYSLYRYTQAGQGE